ncbi:MAG: hypothetical protein LBQ34_03655 [Alphaproteobacteria bacterium]|jgi:multicomponent Na+:H+ antiporter subunit D|nr:hypothetical protein [Alphaproteobacteria bacterium]
MVLINLILPLLAIAIGLLTLKNKKHLFLLAMASGIITVIFMISYTITDGYSSLVFLSEFIYPLYSMMLLFGISFMLGMAFVLSQNKTNYRELGIIVGYFAFTMGILFAENFITLIIYWELASVSGTLIILQSNSERKKYVALKYFVIHSLGGVMLIAGATDFVRILHTEDFPLDYALNINNIGNILILGGILINLALPPFSSWLVDGYSECSPNASIFLSIFTTKSALFVLFRLFHGAEILIYVGIFIAVYGLIFSLFESSLRRILAMSIIHQLGIIIIGVAAMKSFDGFLITYVAVSVLYKLILFMLAAILINKYRTDNIYTLRNSINLKSFLGVALLLCSFQAVGLPLTGGFVVKTYLVDVVGSLDISWLYYVIIILFAGVAVNIGIKVPYYLINFKSTSHKIIMDNNFAKSATIITTIVLLEAIFVLHGIQYFSLGYILHSLEVLAFGMAMFILSALFINKREEKWQVQFNSFKDSSLKISSTVLQGLTSEKPMANVVNYYGLWLNKVSSLIKITTNLSMRYMITFIMIFTILLYLALRFHQF